MSHRLAEACGLTADEPAIQIDRRRALQRALATGLGAYLMAPCRLLAADDPYLRYVDPELRAAAAGILADAREVPPLSMASLTARRGPGGHTVTRPDIPVERRFIPGGPQQPDVAINIVNAFPDGHRPAILHTHGGGFVTGRADEAVPGLQDLCAELGAVAVTVDYRLAPETTFRGSIEDNYAALKWLYTNASSLGVDPRRIAVMGESAGGGHAALLALTARDRGEVPLAFQCLVYPMLDDRTGSSVRPPAHVGRLIWNEADNRFGWKSFLGCEPGTNSVPVRAVPARTIDLAGLPPTFIGVGSLDLFHDEDVEYARRLNDAAVPTQLIVVPGAFHVFDLIGKAIPHARVAPWFNAAKTSALQRALILTS